MKIDLTSADSAFTYLRSLDPSTEVELPGAGEAKHSAAADAVAVITGESPNAWATSMGRWEWTAGEIIAAAQIYLDKNGTVQIGRHWIEHAPGGTAGAAGLLGFSGPVGFVCQACAAKIIGRGCNLKALASVPVWAPEEHPPCDLCHPVPAQEEPNPNQTNK